MPAQTQTTTITEIRLLTPEVRELVLRPPETPVPFEPGQWVSLHLPVGERPPLVRAYSLAWPADPSGSLTLCFDRVPGGLASGYLFEREVGDELTLAGALGNFKLPDPLETDLLFVARYTGIVPIRCMLLALQEHPLRQRVHLVYGAQHPEGLIYHPEFLELAAREPRFGYFPTLLEPANAWSGAVGLELDLLAHLASGWAPYVPMVCGLKEFTRPVRDFFQSLGFERRAVRVEHYD
jgi:phenol hydroxylase P5 protein